MTVVPSVVLEIPEIVLDSGLGVMGTAGFVHPVPVLHRGHWGMSPTVGAQGENQVDTMVSDIQAFCSQACEGQASGGLVSAY